MSIIQDIKETFTYKDGELYWKIHGKGRRHNAPVGAINVQGYKRVMFSGISILVHRAIFAYHHNYFPEQVDHINRDKRDNRIENLRAATMSDNMQNREYKNTKHRNVYQNKVTKRWKVCLKNRGTDIYLGYFATKEEAIAVAEEARNKYHGSFACHL